MHSLVVPVYGNEASIGELLEAIAGLARRLPQPLEAVFVVDGSPDRSNALLRDALPRMPFRSQLLAHSRNFGAFAAIRTGLAAARGDDVAVMAADLQEPIELIERFYDVLARDEADVVVGTRVARADPFFSRLASTTFWWLYRRLVLPQIPPGGVDVFACNRAFRTELLAMGEANTSLVGQLFWLGMRRAVLPYERLERRHGRSGWSFSRKLKYLMDSVFAFSDLPVRLLILVGGLGLGTSLLLGGVVAVARLLGYITLPGYAMTMLTLLFFGGLNTFGLGLIGAYVWRAYENTKQRPLAIVQRAQEFTGTPPP
ncbi:glycosyltransferase involved in cell wall biosynthesis [Dokdonella fugitiva]|uniref:Glycosyltransferase involved in cell wall biosynthesis n=1 Tax=Dokdonella fugitiva TaxID=328517 RepID=A0A839F4P3_9GAMM|nr:glycosyltransferase family 2 protein [Dokdonella fugitiva]MBA8888498.1 glycosyltransferase involved in cell wall biosynthesis [Dokdonella fugitiva]